jgi:hypothetical protein
LDLDKVNPHQEKKLSKRRVYDPANEPLQGENAEQLMRTLRTYDGES